MKKNIFVVLLISLFFLSGCSGDRCIDPDDFGFIKFNISSRYKKEELTSRQEGDQSAPWRDSGYKVNGYPLTIVVRPWDYLAGDKNTASELSAWCPWYSQENNTNTLSTFCAKLQACKFIDDDMCKAAPKALGDAAITNAPCLLKNGVGLYFLIANHGSDPNISPDSQRQPKGITQHLGEPVNTTNTNYNFYSINKTGQLVLSGGINYQYPGVTASNYADSLLYFKILDKFYDDNGGQYRVVIKSGVNDTRPDPLEFLTSLIKNQLFGTSDKDLGIVRQTYQNIIDTPGYRLSVSAILTLYIMFTAFSFLIGNLNLTHVELIIRILKVSIISILLSSTQAWTFFHDYLFVFFVEGVEQILAIIKAASATGPGSQSLIGLLIAPQTLSKLFSLLFVDPLGFIYIILYLIALYFIFMLVFKATIIYLTALIAIGMIITMAPIFICFMLFNITRSLFENWLRQLISYALQPIILFVGIAFISMIIRSEIYSTLGFGVCKYDFPNLGPINELFGSFTEDLDVSLGDSIFYWWFPSPMKGGTNNFHKANILVPIDYKKDDGTFCNAYECIDNRYIELPFLDLTKDAQRISNFINGKFVQLDGLLLIFVSIYLLSKFNDTAVSLAKFLAGTSGNLTNIQKIANQAYTPIQTIINKPMSYTAGKAGTAMNRLQERFISQPLAEKYEKFMTSRLATDALDEKKANKSVLAAVKRKYGMELKNVQKNAGADYETAIQNLLTNKDLLPKGVEFSKEEQAKLSSMGYTKLRDEIAAKKFQAKDYNSLTKEQKAELDKLMKPKEGEKSIRELAIDAKFAQDYQKAYINAHQEMSGKGVGLIGKNIEVVRNWQKMQNRVKTKRELRDAKHLAIGEKIYAGYEGLKRGALTAVVGKDLRDAYEGTLTGAAWHDYDYTDARLRTYDESLADKDRDREYQELKLKIDKETLSTQEDVLAPEYLARLELQGRKDDASYYEDLAKKKLSHEIRHKLSEGEEPVIMGDRFMREKATDSQMRKMIDNAAEKHSELINEDWYASREDHYNIMREKAVENIEKQYSILKDHYGKDDIKIEEMPTLLEQYYREKKDTPVDEIAKELNNFKADVKNFDYSGEVLTKIEHRKEEITKEVKSHIEEISQYRTNAKMEKYGKPIEYEPRKLRKLEDHLRNMK
ncbi:type IV secretion system protein [Rickettsia endosymbiont of Halotydeus destructor]|uniref:type IV secretion system protein n=1 Tax=Rickettsia endosymbiont of Halotydeus destructor TaxID=2996754 RepID=UPI003BAFC6DC